MVRLNWKKKKYIYFFLKVFQKTWKENKEPDSENMKGKYRAWFRRHERKKRAWFRKHYRKIKRPIQKTWKENIEPDLENIIEIKSLIQKTWKENIEPDSEDMKGKYRAWFRRHERKIKSPIQKTWQEKKPDSENMKGKYRAWLRRLNRKKIIEKENKKNSIQ